MVAIEIKRSPWQLAADDVISVLLQPEERKAYEYAVYERGLSSWHFPPREPHSPLFSAIWSCYGDGKPLHDTVVLEAAGGAVALNQYYQLSSLYDPIRANFDTFKANLDIVIERGRAFSDLGIIEDSARRLRSGKDRSEVVDALIGVLSSDGPDSLKEVTIGKALAHHEKYMNEAEHIHLIKTGIPWWDDLTGGLKQGFISWLVAAYKMRKSSVMRNMILGALANGGSVTLGTLEGDQNRVVAELKVMLAVMYMLEHGTYNLKYKNKQNVLLSMNEISSAQLLAAGSSYKTTWPKQQVEALAWATEKLASYDPRLRIYDSTRRAGKLHDMASVNTMIRADKAMYGANVIFLDYMQRIGGSTKIFDRVSANSMALQDAALSEQVSLVVLAQLNEESIKGLGSNGWESGVKGGGDAAATADYMAATRYMVDDNGEVIDDDQHLTLTMKLSRHGMMGPGTKEVLMIHPWTGLIIPPEYEAIFYGRQG